jgi:hypothetical protein
VFLVEERSNEWGESKGPVDGVKFIVVIATKRVKSWPHDDKV